jgi:CubicO group peptidase (beta-lactamase class C family)
MKYAKVLLLSILLYTEVLAQSPQQLTNSAKPEDAGMSTVRLDRIGVMIEDYVKKESVPGAVALIVRNGKIVYYKAYGYSDREKKIVLKKDDIFRIASQTKAITSLAVMMLFEEGKFLLDEPVSKYIPEFKSPTVLKSFNPKDSTYTTEPAKSEITIRHLLTHTSGIDYAVIGSDPFKAIYAKAGIPSGIGNERDVLGDKMKKLGKLPLRHHPGEQWTYGLNTDLLGYLVEVWSGMTFNDFLQKRIFQPLGMKDTYFYLPTDRHRRLVPLYEGIEGKSVRVKAQAYGVNPDYATLNGTYYSGGAGLTSTVEDYAKFLQLFLNKGEFNGVKLLSRKTVELMLTDQLSQPNTPEFGLGFGLETDTNDYQSILSKGSFQWGGAFNTHFWADPKENLIGVLYTNVYQTPAWDIGDRFKVLTYQSIVD